MPQLDCYYWIMNKFKFFLKILILLSFLTSCETIKQKTDAIVEKENQKLSKFIGKSSSELQINLGKPDEDFKNEKGNIVFVYNTKKTEFQWEGKFKINEN